MEYLHSQLSWVFLNLNCQNFAYVLHSIRMFFPCYTSFAESLQNPCYSFNQLMYFSHVVFFLYAQIILLSLLTDTPFNHIFLSRIYKESFPSSSIFLKSLIAIFQMPSLSFAVQLSIKACSVLMQKVQKEHHTVILCAEYPVATGGLLLA